MTTWVFAIDFGTTNTVASVGDASGIRTLNVDGRPVMPSAVFLERLDKPGSPDSWIVGERAVHMARRRLDRFEPNPKRWVADGVLFLGGRDVPVSDAIAALLDPIVAEAAGQFSAAPPALAIVTHPASWAADRVEVLRRAVRAATRGRNWPEPATLEEPVAAAQRTLRVPDVPAHCRLVVLDFGGGTVDVSVVDRHDDTVTVVGPPTGNDQLGGEDFDIQLAEWMCAEIRHPGLYRHWADSDDPDRQEHAVELRTHARTVKEELSKRTVVHGQVLGAPPELPQTTPVQVSRDQLERLISGGPGQPPGLVEAVRLVDDAMRKAPPGPPFGGVFLVGGSSRITRLGVLVTEKTGRLPITHGDPTTAVSDGAAQFAWRRLQQAPPAPPPPPAAPPRQTPPVAPPVPVGHPVPRKKRRTLVPLLLLLLALAGTGVAYAATRSDPYEPGYSYTCWDGSVVSSSYSCPTRPATGGTTRPTRQSTTGPAAASGDTLVACSGSAKTTCAGTVLANSRKVWPELATAGSNCATFDHDFGSGVDRYSAFCRASSGLEYGVAWRASGASYPAVIPIYANWTGGDPESFSLKASGDVGEWVYGPATSDNGDEVFACAWEYEDYPVALVLTGPNNATTSGACDDATFLTDAAMAELFN